MKPSGAQWFRKNRRWLSALVLCVLMVGDLGGWLRVSMVYAAGSSGPIQADPNAPASQRPVVTSSGSGLPVVNIATPTAGGVSVNKYLQFNVPGQTGKVPAGAILNNGQGGANSIVTQLDGKIDGNPNLHNGSAKVILNEVTNTSRSQLSGPLEVAGSQAAVVVANPNGIYCAGCSFINADRVTLTTGKPNTNDPTAIATPSDMTFAVTGGVVTVGSGGLNGNAQQQIDILARAVELQDKLQASNGNLTFITGSNTIRYSDLGISLIANPDGKPAVAVDVGLLGGAYANGIRMAVTEGNVVNINGQLLARSGGFGLKSNGDLVVGTTGQIQSGTTASADTTTTIAEVGDTRITAAQVTNHGHIYSTGVTEIGPAAGNGPVGALPSWADANTPLSVQSLINTATGRMASSQAMTLSAGTISNDGVLASGMTPDGTGFVDVTANPLVSHDLTLSAQQSLKQAGVAESAAGLNYTAAVLDLNRGRNIAGGDVSYTLTASGTIAHQNAVTQADGGIGVQTTNRGVNAGVDNTGGQWLANGNIVFDQVGGALSNGNSATQTGTLQSNAGDVFVRTTGAVNNAGKILAHGDIWLGYDMAIASYQGSGLVQANGDIDVYSAGDITVVAQPAGQAYANGFAGSGTLSVMSTDGNVSNAGVMAANESIDLAAAGTLINTAGGSLQSASGPITIDVSHLANDGLVNAGGAIVVITANDVANAGSIVGAATLAIDAGASVTNSGKMVAAAAIEMLAGGSMTNSGSVSSYAGPVKFTAASLQNTGRLFAGSDVTGVVRGDIGNAGFIGGDGALALTNSGGMTNTGTLSANTGVTISVSGALTNSGNLLSYYGPVSFAAASLLNSGFIYGGNVITGSVMRAIDNSGSIEGKGSLTLTTVNGNVSNAGIISADTVLAISASSGALTNSGTLMSADGGIAVSAGTLKNTSTGLIYAGGDIDAKALSGAIDNAGVMGGRGDLVLAAQGNLTNDGILAALGNLSSTAAAIANNTRIVSEGLLSLTATSGDLMNRNELTGGSLALQAKGLLTNDGSINTTAGDATLAAANLNNNATKQINVAGNLTLGITGQINNVDGAQINVLKNFTSSGSLTDPAALSGGFLNSSAYILVGGDASISAGTIQNIKTRAPTTAWTDWRELTNISKGDMSATTSTVDGITIKTPWTGNGQLDSNTFINTCGSLCYTMGKAEYLTDAGSAAAVLSAGGSLTLKANDITNAYSSVSAGGGILLNASSGVTNTAINLHYQEKQAEWSYYTITSNYSLYTWSNVTVLGDGASQVSQAAGAVKASHQQNMGGGGFVLTSDPGSYMNNLANAINVNANGAIQHNIVDQCRSGALLCNGESSTVGTTISGAQHGFTQLVTSETSWASRSTPVLGIYNTTSGFYISTPYYLGNPASDPMTTLMTSTGSSQAVWQYSTVPSTISSGGGMTITAGSYNNSGTVAAGQTIVSPTINVAINGANSLIATTASTASNIAAALPSPVPNAMLLPGALAPSAVTPMSLPKTSAAATVAQMGLGTDLLVYTPTPVPVYASSKVTMPDTAGLTSFNTTVVNAGSFAQAQAARLLADLNPNQKQAVDIVLLPLAGFNPDQQDLAAITMLSEQMNSTERTDSIQLNVAGDLTNTGTMTGSVHATARNISNSGTIRGDDITLDAANALAISGDVTAYNTVTLKGSKIDITTATVEGDNGATIHSTGEGGINLTSAQIVASPSGSVSMTADKGNINLNAIVATVSSFSFTHSGDHGGTDGFKSSSWQVGSGSGIVGGNVALEAADGSINVVGSNLGASDTLSLSARDNVTIQALELSYSATSYSSDQAAAHVDSSSEWGTSSSSSRLTAGNLAVSAGKAFSFIGSQAQVEKDLVINAQEVTIAAAQNTYGGTSTSRTKESNGDAHYDGTSTTTFRGTSGAASNFVVGGDVQIGSADGPVNNFTLQGSVFEIAGSAVIEANNINILAQTNTYQATTTSSGTWTNASSQATANQDTGPTYGETYDGVGRANGGKGHATGGKTAGAGVGDSASAAITLSKTETVTSTQDSATSFASALKVGKNLTLNARNDITIVGGRDLSYTDQNGKTQTAESGIIVGGDLSAVAGGSINVLAGIDYNKTSTSVTTKEVVLSSDNQAGASASSGGNGNTGGGHGEATAQAGATSNNFFGSIDTTTTEKSTKIHQLAATLKSGGSTTLKASRGDVTLQGTTLETGGDMEVSAGRNINISALKDYESTTTTTTKTMTGMWVDGSANASAGATADATATSATGKASADASTALNIFVGTETSMYSRSTSTIASTGASITSGGNARFKAGNDLVTQATDLTVGHDLSMDATNILNLAAENATTTTESESSIKLGAYLNTTVSGSASASAAGSVTGAFAEATASSTQEVRSGFEIDTHIRRSVDNVTTATVSNFKIGGNLTRTASQRIMDVGAGIDVGGDLTQTAATYTFAAAQNSTAHSETSLDTSTQVGIYARTQESASAFAGSGVVWGAGAGASTDTDASATAGVDARFSMSFTSETEASSSQTAGSIRAGGKLALTSTGSTTLVGTAIDADSVALTASSLDYLAAVSTHSASYTAVSADVSVYAGAGVGSMAFAGGGSAGAGGGANAGYQVEAGFSASFSMEHDQSGARTSTAGAITAARGLTLTASGGDLTLVGTALKSGADTTIDAAGSFNYLAALSSSYETDVKVAASMSLDVSVITSPVDVSTSLTAAFSLDTAVYHADSQTAEVGKIEAGGNLTVRTGANASFEGTKMVASGTAAMDAGGNVTFTAPQTYSHVASTDVSLSGFVRDIAAAGLTADGHEAYGGFNATVNVDVSAHEHANVGGFSGSAGTSVKAKGAFSQVGKAVDLGQVQAASKTEMAAAQDVNVEIHVGVGANSGSSQNGGSSNNGNDGGGAGHEAAGQGAVAKKGAGSGGNDGAPGARNKLVAKKDGEHGSKGADTSFPEKPKMARSDDKYDSRVVLQAGSDPVTQRAARDLADKHPGTVFAVLDKDGSVAPIQGELAQLKGNTKVSVVGHGDADSSAIGGADAQAIAEAVRRVGETPGAQVDKVALVGCNSGKCAAPKLQAALGDGVAVKGYDSPVKVNSDGSKELTNKDDSGALPKTGSQHPAQGQKENTVYRLDARPPSEIALEGFQGTQRQFWNKLYGDNTVYTAKTIEGIMEYAKEAMYNKPLNSDGDNDKPFSEDHQPLANRDAYVYQLDISDVDRFDIGKQAFIKAVRADDAKALGRADVDVNSPLFPSAVRYSVDSLRKYSGGVLAQTPDTLALLNDGARQGILDYFNKAAKYTEEIIVEGPLPPEKIRPLGVIKNGSDRIQNLPLNEAQFFSPSASNRFDKSENFLPLDDDNESFLIESIRRMYPNASDQLSGDDVSNKADNAEVSSAERFDGRLVLQAGHDLVTEMAARNLAAKHPENTVLAKLEPDGRLVSIQGELGQLKGNTKVSVVGHGDADSSAIGGADELAITEAVRRIGETPGTQVDKVALVGCDSGKCAAPTLIAKLPGIEVKGYGSALRVNANGSKQPTTASDPGALVSEWKSLSSKIDQRTSRKDTDPLPQRPKAESTITNRKGAAAATDDGRGEYEEIDTGFAAWAPVKFTKMEDVQSRQEHGENIRLLVHTAPVDDFINRKGVFSPDPSEMISRDVICASMYCSENPVSYGALGVVLEVPVQNIVAASHHDIFSDLNIGRLDQVSRMILQTSIDSTLGARSSVERAALLTERQLIPSMRSIETPEQIIRNVQKYVTRHHSEINVITRPDVSTYPGMPVTRQPRRAAVFFNDGYDPVVEDTRAIYSKQELKSIFEQHAKDVADGIRDPNIVDKSNEKGAAAGVLKLQGRADTVGEPNGWSFLSSSIRNLASAHDQIFDIQERKYLIGSSNGESSSSTDFGQGEPSVFLPGPLDIHEHTYDLGSDSDHDDTLRNSTTTFIALYGGRLVLQADGDAVAETAARTLAAKHPENTVLAKLRQDGSMDLVQGELKQLKGNIKVSVVGHGDAESSGIGEADASVIAETVRQVSEFPGRSVSKVALVGCETGACAASTLKEALGLVVAVKGYDTPLRVNSDGTKEPTTANDPKALPHGAASNRNAQLMNQLRDLRQRARELGTSQSGSDAQTSLIRDVVQTVANSSLDEQNKRDLLKMQSSASSSDSGFLNYAAIQNSGKSLAAYVQSIANSSLAPNTKAYLLAGDGADDGDSVLVTSLHNKPEMVESYVKAVADSSLDEQMKQKVLAARVDGEPGLRKALMEHDYEVVNAYVHAVLNASLAPETKRILLAAEGLDGTNFLKLVLSRRAGGGVFPDYVDAIAKSSLDEQIKRSLLGSALATQMLPAAKR